MGVMMGDMDKGQKTFSQDFNLDEKDFNNAQALKMLRNRNKQAIKQYGDYTLWEFPQSYALIRNDVSEIGYIVKFKYKYFNRLQRKCVSQVMVWRDIGVAEQMGMAREIFFNYLLPTTQTIISDSMQTPEGKAFWWRRIHEAFSNGMYVYYINLTQPSTFIKVSNAQELRAIDSASWGDHQRYQSSRVIITTKSFDKDLLTG